MQEGGRDEETDDKIRNVKQKIFDILSSPPRTAQRAVYTERQVARIVLLCRVCPDLAVDYVTAVIDVTSAKKNRGCCLEIFALSIPRLRDADSIVRDLDRVELRSVLTNRESFCEATALRIVRELVGTAIAPAVLLPYVKLAIPYLDDNSAEHRGLVYDLLMSVYKKYSTDSDDESATTLRSESARQLLTALLDPSEKLQARVLRFWTEETDLSAGRSKERLTALLNLRTKIHPLVNQEDAYALLVPLLILELASRSRDYTEKMFDSLGRGTYEDYRIAVTWSRQNLSHVAPMFVDSFASQMSCTLSQSIDRGTSDYRSGVLKLRATQDPQFEPTVTDDEAANVVDATTTFSNDDGFDRVTLGPSPRRPQQACGRRFPRFLSSADAGEQIRHKHIQENVQRQEMIKQENIKQRNSVRLYR